MSAEPEGVPPRSSPPAPDLARSPLRLRVAALPALWSSWIDALDEARATTAGAARPRRDAFDAAVVEFTLAAKEQGASVTTILRVLDILAREAAGDAGGEAAAPRGTSLRDRAGRVSMH